MKILLTSFDTWKPEQPSNSSDDLLQELIDRSLLTDDHHCLRKVVVEFDRAPEQVIAAITELQPDLVVCCGMAESREVLSIESNGKCGEEILITPIAIDPLIDNLNVTLSDDAGTFVCNHLYHAVLKHTREQSCSCKGLFVHIPVLTQDNLESIVHDFHQMLQRLAQVNP